MSSASSNQSFVRDGAGYEEVYLSGYRDLDDLSEERSPSASSPSSKNEDMEVTKPEEGSDDGEDQRIKFVIGADGLRSLSCYQSGRLMPLHPPSRRHTSKPLGPTTKYLITSPSVYLISQKNVTMKG